MPRTISFTKRAVLIGAVIITGILSATVSPYAGAAFAFCTFVVMTA